jgi:hypothetical protein
MQVLCFNIKLLSFKELTGLDVLGKEIEKFRELRDSYREMNRAHYGEYLASLLDD